MEITNKAVTDRLNEIISLTCPAAVMWIDGSDEQVAELRAAAIQKEIVLSLNPDTHPDCLLHRTTVGNAASTASRTYVCTPTPNEVGPTNLHKDPCEAYNILRELFDGVMKNRTMYVIPFRLGNDELGLNKVGISITDSLYVVLNTLMLAHCGKDAAETLSGMSELDKWELCLHSTGTAPAKQQFIQDEVGENPRILFEDNRYICHFPQDNAVWAINTGYAAGAFLTKESSALRMASIAARDEGWFAEHMAIIEVTIPEHEPMWIAAAFPPGCGKTALAFLDVPEEFAQKGYKVRCLSDDVAWLKKGKDGRLWAINPETGIFAACPNISAEMSPSLYALTRNRAYLTNVVHNQGDNSVWWEGLDNGAGLSSAIDWKGEPWSPSVVSAAVEQNKEQDPELDNDWSVPEPGEEDDIDLDDEAADEVADSKDGDVQEEKDVNADDVSSTDRGAHPNSRFTSELASAPTWVGEKAVPISAIIFGGRRTKAIPLVYQAFDWNHGVFIGSALGTEPLGSRPGVTVRRDPMAMLSHCGYNMADYWRHWLKLGKKLGRAAPKIFGVNWYRTGDNGKFAWPGFGENIRVLEWIVKRSVQGKSSLGIVESAAGYLPKLDDINIDGLVNPCYVPFEPEPELDPEAAEAVEAVKAAEATEAVEAPEVAEVDDADEADEADEAEKVISAAKAPKSVLAEILSEFGDLDGGKPEPVVENLNSDIFTKDNLNRLLRVEKVPWKEDVNGVRQFYAQFGDDLPEELRVQLADLERRLLILGISNK